MINKFDKLSQEEVFNLYNFYFMLYNHKAGDYNGKNVLSKLGYKDLELIEATRFFVKEELIDFYNLAVDKYTSDNLFSRVVDWSDRQKTQYFIEQLHTSDAFESKISDFFLEKYSINIGFYHGKEQYKGESLAGIEIKNDKVSETTGNYAIECYEKSNKANKNWVKSGILKEDNTEYFLSGYISDDSLNYKIFKKSTLLTIWKNKDSFINENKIKLYNEKKHETSKGFLILKNSVEEFEENIENVVNHIIENHPDLIDN